MSNKFKYLQLKNLDQYLKEIRFCARPSDGWVRAIRKSLGMSAKQLAGRIGVSQQALSQLESKELEDAVTIKILRKAAEAMDCKLVYAIVPNESSLESIVRKQATKKAKEIVYAVDHTMMLEAQDVGNIQEKIIQISEDLAGNPDSKLWE